MKKAVRLELSVAEIVRTTYQVFVSQEVADRLQNDENFLQKFCNSKLCVEVDSKEIHTPVFIEQEDDTGVIEHVEVLEVEDNVDVYDELKEDVDDE